MFPYFSLWPKVSVRLRADQRSTSINVSENANIVVFSCRKYAREEDYALEDVEMKGLT